jgi:four helix bundle protein
VKEYTFEKLDVWKNSRGLTKEIYILTNNFPKTEQYGLTNQLRRAMFSVSCNLSKGVTRWSHKEKCRFIEISCGSLMEVLNCLILSYDLQYIDGQALSKLRIAVDEIALKES